MTSKRYQGNIITDTPTEPTENYINASASGIWSVAEAYYYTKANKWPSAANAAPSQQAYTTPGTYSWVAPTGVSSVSVVAVGGGGSRGGGGLGYKNNIAVTPGSSYTVVVGVGGSAITGIQGGDSYFINTSTVKGGGGTSTVGGSFTGDGGGNGGEGSFSGGGAGGYAGNGGNSNSGAAANSGGGGGGGFDGTGNNGYGGGGVGILGIGATGGVNQGGSGGGDGLVSGNVRGGLYGGGGSYGVNYGNGSGAGGAVRIIWPGTARSFPSTDTGDV